MRNICGIILAVVVGRKLEVRGEGRLKGSAECGQGENVQSRSCFLEILHE